MPVAQLVEHLTFNQGVVPENVTTVTVYLEATGGTDDSVILDDVSLTVV